MNPIITFILGMLLGIVLILTINWLKRKDVKVLAQELVNQAESQKVQNLESIISRIKDSFGMLSMEILSKNTEELIKLANETLSKQSQIGEKELENKKILIDEKLGTMKEDMQKVQELITNFEKDREGKFKELANQLKYTADQTSKLQETTNKLHSALANTKVRGQWGERMAEDVLRLSGFIEGVNYIKQKINKIGTIPDYTFLLPQSLKLNMDVKFPLDNYLHYLEVASDNEKEVYKKQFLKDVKARIKEVTTRDYINPEDNTVDYVIVFIPNEQVYAFINENDSSILDEALRNKVILCSPLTLYAVLAIIRQAVDNFNIEKTASQMLSLFGAFKKQWEEFVKSFDKMGKKIEEVQKEFNYLSSTRSNQLERSLRQIDELRSQKGIEVYERFVEEELIRIESAVGLEKEDE